MRSRGPATIVIKNVKDSATTITYIRGPPRFLPTGAPLRERYLPQFVGGVHHLQSLLLTPYPVIPPYVVRTPHPGITDDREHIHHELQHESPATQTSSVGPDMSAMRKAK